MQTSTLKAYAADVVRRSRPLWYCEAKAIDTATLIAYAESYGDHSISLIWADKVGIYLATAGFAIFTYVWTLAALTVGLAGADHLLARGIGLAFECYAVLTLVIWLGCRAGDWVAAARRRWYEQML
jgi:hypothetical protein